MILTSERLLFRPYSNDDFDFLMSLLSDPEVVRFIGKGKTRNENGGKEFLKWIYSTYEVGEDMGLMVLVNKEDNTLIGHAGLVPQIIEGNEEIEIGYWICREHWGKGYATESAKALLEYGIKQINPQRFISLIQPDNLASKKVANKIEMKFDKRIIIDGKDVNVYATI
ncbi:GNAT family N-acetyltransferase [Aquibacillus rhizosphaerae]|uniref:GNAT family N-acetyltransferase n=1 Tax=Aquibacillus rhizosphaerae TaxID=3051431 RepID=A0ABT7L0V3_9BACI|nr:GNAT family N-acetyltransferase [Aquibacillus sp. LR5S19]MDL4839413.1 GNAT family N-acetyltransferase [Aquibacillus sp. LR5S19]